MSLLKADELTSCPKCGDRNLRGCLAPEISIPPYEFRRGKRYCNGAACIIAPMSGEHMHDSCRNCGYTWAEELPDLSPKPATPRRSFWEWLANLFGGECL